MKSYEAIKAQIAKLEKEAERARRRALKGVIAQVKKMIAQHGLTTADLGLGGRVGAAAKPGRAKAAARPPKYRNAKTGETWTGHGRPPRWIVAAKDRSAFLVDAPAAAPATAPTPAPAGKKAATKKSVNSAATKSARKVTGKVAQKVVRKPAAKVAKKAGPKAGKPRITTPAVQIESGAATS